MRAAGAISKMGPAPTFQSFRLRAVRPLMRREYGDSLRRSAIRTDRIPFHPQGAPMCAYDDHAAGLGRIVIAIALFHFLSHCGLLARATTCRAGRVVPALS